MLEKILSRLVKGVTKTIIVPLTAGFLYSCSPGFHPLILFDLKDSEEILEKDGFEETFEEKNFLDDCLKKKYFKDNDKDGYGDPNQPNYFCEKVEGYAENNLDCDDNNELTYPKAEELCDNKDNDCDELIDEDVKPIAWYPDQDGDGFGGEENVKYDCKPIPGYSHKAGDCDDKNYNINPDALEVCDGKDNNCNKLIDEGLDFKDWYLDNDGDGYGSKGSKINSCKKPGESYILKGGDCDDENYKVNPDASEVCNGLDDNCNELIDEGLTKILCYPDKDQDGFGSDQKLETCLGSCPAYTSKSSGDCDDEDDKTNPLAKEECDLKDNNCDGKTDEGLEKIAKCDVYNDNLNGTKKQDCVKGEYKDVSECNDPDECTAGKAKKDVCSLNKGICKEGWEDFVCQLEDNFYQWMGKNNCSGILPQSEDTGKFPDGLDNDCDGEVDEVYMVGVEAGGFKMGCWEMPCPSDAAPHTVNLDEYSIFKFEITNKQYNECVKANVCSEPSSKDSYTHKCPNDCYYGNPKYDNYPVIYVNWEQARIFCVWMGGNEEEINEVKNNPYVYKLFSYDLPTEAQWEKAAKDLTVAPYPWGPVTPTCENNFCNFNMCVGDVTEVGSYENGKSPYGVYDMSGNVMEWVFDWYGSYVFDNPFVAVENPMGPQNGDKKVVRGGSWLSVFPKDITTYVRASSMPNLYDFGTGVRCVKNNG